MSAKQKAIFAHGPYKLRQIQTLLGLENRADLLEPEQDEDVYEQQW
jgi:hypothetical protein